MWEVLSPSPVMFRLGSQIQFVIVGDVNRPSQTYYYPQNVSVLFIKSYHCVQATRRHSHIPTLSQIYTHIHICMYVNVTLKLAYPVHRIINKGNLNSLLHFMGFWKELTRCATERKDEVRWIFTQEDGCDAKTSRRRTRSRQYLKPQMNLGQK